MCVNDATNGMSDRRMGYIIRGVTGQLVNNVKETQRVSRNAVSWVRGWQGEGGSTRLLRQGEKLAIDIIILYLSRSKSRYPA